VAAEHAPHRAGWGTALMVAAAWAAAGGALAQPAAPASAAASSPWLEAGRQGVTRLVIVPMAQARDKAAYLREIATLCAGVESCFINFYTNSSGAEVTVPLPDAIAQQAVASYRLSAKRGSEVLRFSCRLALEEPNCF